MALVRPPVSYPGVYIQEVQSDVRTITPVDTATTAFLGRTLRGPVNKPVICNSFADFERIFGGLWLESQLGYAVSDFFLNGGSKAVIVRLFNPDTPGRKAAAEVTKELSSEKNALIPSAELAAKTYTSDEESKAAAKVVEAVKQAMKSSALISEIIDVAKKDGVAAVVTASQNAAKVRDAEVVGIITAAEGAANQVPDEPKETKEAAQKTVKKMKDTALKAVEQTASAVAKDVVPTSARLKIAGPNQAAIAVYKAVESISATSTPGQLAEAADSAANLYLTADSATKDAANAVKAAVTAAVGENNSTQETVVAARRAALADTNGPAVTLEAKHQGAWGNRLVARVTDVDPKVKQALAHQYEVADPDQLFNLTIRDIKTGAEEYHPNVTLVDGKRRLDNVLRDRSDLVMMLAPPERNAVRLVANPTPTTRWWEDSTALVKVDDTSLASDGAALNDAVFEGNEALKQGIYALEQADIFNMLCIPPYNGDEVPANILALAAAYCEKRRAMLIVDPRAGWTHKDEVKEDFPVPGISPTPNAAVFFPRIMKQNPLRDNQVEPFVPCGAIAGVIARTDFRRGVWKAPAGLEATLNGVVALEVPLTDAENGELNPLGVNCLRTMPAAGPVVWGARTLQGDDRLASQWKYIPVRRMALWIEETLYRSTQWAVFEPNDEPLWSSLRLNIGAFMHDLYRQGAFQGKTPKDAYFVRCDSTTTTQSDIDRGIVNVVIGFAPLKPAEFVILYIQQINGNLAI